jgi:hypothetical protein
MSYSSNGNLIAFGGHGGMYVLLYECYLPILIILLLPYLNFRLEVIGLNPLRKETQNKQHSESIKTFGKNDNVNERNNEDSESRNNEEDSESRNNEEDRENNSSGISLHRIV